MSNTDNETEGLGTRVLTWALIVGAALMLAEVTLSPAQPVSTKTATVQTVSVASVAHHDRFARN
jgi:hypothetical protein